MRASSSRRRERGWPGPINLAAIDDYAALDERYTHLREQETDLLTAMGQLQETMDEMDAEVIKRFSEAFHQINQQFQKIFKKLLDRKSTV